MYPRKLVSYKCLECDSEHFAQGSDTVLCKAFALLYLLLVQR